MSDKGTCASCLDFDIEKPVKSTEELKPTWLLKHDYVREFIDKQSLKLRTPTKYDTEMKLELGQRFAGKRILYWATDEKKTKALL